MSLQTSAPSESPDNRIVLPYRYTPRPYQQPILTALKTGIKRAVAVWHRRAGKEKTFINYVAWCAFKRVGTYFYLFPTYTQAKKVLWDGRDKDGFPFMAHFPKEVIAKKNESELRLELVNGSAIQLVGSDNIDSVLGTNPIGCVFSEYALQDPRAWDYMRPILRENGGWAIFDYTPRGKNHGYTLFQMAKANPDWYAEILTVEDTGALSEADIQAERSAGMSEELIQQEFYCSFEGVQVGTVFGAALHTAEKEGRICAVPWEPEIPVDTWWDPGLGFGVWFTQTIGRGEIHVIDYYGGSKGGPDVWGQHLQTLPYIWGEHNGPPDIEHPQYAQNGKSVKELMQKLGYNLKASKLATQEDQIRAGNRIMSKCWFDRNKTAEGRNALESYHFPWDEKRKMYAEKPYHDWSSHASAAWMQLGMGHKLASPVREPPKVEILTYSKNQENVAWMG